MSLKFQHYFAFPSLTENLISRTKQSEHLMGQSPPQGNSMVIVVFCFNQVYQVGNFKVSTHLCMLLNENLYINYKQMYAYVNSGLLHQKKALIFIKTN